MKFLKSLANLLVFFVTTSFFTGCSFSGSTDLLSRTRNDLLALQKNEDVKTYAPNEMRQAEDSVIAAVNAWNDGQASESERLSLKAQQEIELAYKVAKGEASLGLSKQAWEQRRFLQQVRKERLATPQS